VELREPPDERQPDTDARRMLRRVGALPERFEDRLAELGRDARPVVLHEQEDAIGGRMNADPDRGGLRRVPDGVGEQVLDDPLDLRGVHGDGDRRDVRPEA
jgi:hypothetical protein